MYGMVRETKLETSNWSQFAAMMIMLYFVVVAPNWSLPFELMCDASDSVVGVVLGQRKKRCSIRSTRLVEHLMTPKIITPQ